MVTKEIAIKVLLHARPASNLVREVSRYQSDIHIEHDGQRVSGKSMLGIMTLGVKRGDQITLFVEGDDENDALESLVSYIDSGCGE